MSPATSGAASGGGSPSSKEPSRPTPACVGNGTRRFITLKKNAAARVAVLGSALVKPSGADDPAGAELVLEGEQFTSLA